MWSKPVQLTATGTARPLRVAYLIDPENCPHELLDAIFREGYSRWGGRRTLIVPATEDGIDHRYRDWLWFYDADVIYSYLQLSDDAIATIHEKYGPAYLHRHTRVGVIGTGDPIDYRPNLPINAVSSLSIIPTVLTRTWGFVERITNLKLLDKFWDGSKSRFLEENFGFVGTSFQPPVAQANPDLFSCVTLITPQSLAAPHLLKPPANEYLVDEATVMAALGQRGGPLTLANLSELLAPQLEFAESTYGWTGALSLIVGDAVDDRLLFWNEHHLHHDLWLRDVAGLRVSLASVKDKKFVSSLKGIIRERGPRRGSQPDQIFLRSCSVGQEELDEVAEFLRNTEHGYLGVTAISHRDHSACVPKFGNPLHVGYRNSVTLREALSTESTEFKDREHGMEAVIYALWRVSERAQSSFYFAPSMTLWEDYPEVEGATKIEIDALMVVDARLYLCEAKSSPTLDEGEIENLISAAKRIRPDVVLIACMDENAAGLNRAMQTLKERLPQGIETELLPFQPSALEADPILPH